MQSRNGNGDATAATTTSIAVTTPRRTTNHDFATSNSTSNHFLGTSQRSWMTPSNLLVARKDAQPGGRRSSLNRAEQHATTKQTDASTDTAVNNSVSNPASKTVVALPWQSDGGSRHPSQSFPPPQPAPNLNQDLPPRTVLHAAHPPASSENRPSLSSTVPPSNHTTPSFQLFGDGVASDHLSQIHPATLSHSPSFPSGRASGSSSIQSVPASMLSPPLPQSHWQSFTTTEPLRFSVQTLPNIPAPSNDAAIPNSFTQADHHPHMSNTATLSGSPTLANPMCMLGAPESRKRPAQTVIDTSNKRPRPDTTATEQIPTPTSTPVLASQTLYSDQLRTSIDRLSEQMRLTTIDQQRITLLKQACDATDGFFLILHQIYTLSSLPHYRQTVTRLGFGAAETAGLNILAHILIANHNISRDLLIAFAHFPHRPEDLSHSSLSQIVEQVKGFLVLLARKWDRLLRVSHDRRVPPCCEEFVFYFSLFSSVMRKTLFLSLERQITGDQNPSWIHQALGLYEASQDRWSAQVLQPGYDIRMALQSAVDRFCNEYCKIRAAPRRIVPPVLPGDDSTRSPEALQHLHRGLESHQPRTVGPNGQAHLVNSYDTASPVQPGQQNFLHSGTLHSTDVMPPPQSQARPMTIPQQLHPSSGSNDVLPWTPSSTSPFVRDTNNQGFSAPPPSYPVATARLPWTAALRRRGRPPKERGPSRTLLSFAQTVRVASTLNRQPPIAAQYPSQTTAATSTSIASPALGPFQIQFLDRFVPDSDATLLPFPGYVLAQTNPPNVDRNALHQIHLGSPPPVTEATKEQNSKERLYAYPESCILPLQRVNDTDKFLVWHFDISEALHNTKARRLPPATIDAPSNRFYQSDSTLVRLKCAKRLATLNSPDLHEFSEMGISWPDCVYLSLNETPDIELRRKSHWGRDLAVDLTDLVKIGSNTLKLSYYSTSTEKKEAFYFSVEVVRIADHAKTLALVRAIDSDTVLSTIVSQLNIDHDDEISFADPTISIDLIDPFMAKIWKVPVRGIRCKHRECFDLEAFLLSRTTRQTNGPTDPDRWNCPICSKDARPQYLLIDEFLLDVRAQLEADGKLETRAILVKQDGTWEAKKETDKGDDPDTEALKVNRMKSKSTSANPDAAGNLGSDKDTAMNQAGGIVRSASMVSQHLVEIIEIEDND